MELLLFALSVCSTGTREVRIHTYLPYLLAYLLTTKLVGLHAFETCYYDIYYPLLVPVSATNRRQLVLIIRQLSHTFLSYSVPRGREKGKEGGGQRAKKKKKKILKHTLKCNHSVDRSWFSPPSLSLAEIWIFCLSARCPICLVILIANQASLFIRMGWTGRQEGRQAAQAGSE